MDNNNKKKYICIHNENKYRCRNCPYRQRHKKYNPSTFMRKPYSGKSYYNPSYFTTIVGTSRYYTITPDSEELNIKLIEYVGEDLAIPDSYMEFPSNEYINFDHGTWPIHTETQFKINSRIISINKVCKLFGF
jgi:hypothetical protein